MKLENSDKLFYWTLQPFLAFEIMVVRSFWGVTRRQDDFVILQTISGGRKVTPLNKLPSAFDPQANTPHKGAGICFKSTQTITFQWIPSLPNKQNMIPFQAYLRAKFCGYSTMAVLFLYAAG